MTSTRDRSIAMLQPGVRILLIIGLALGLGLNSFVLSCLEHAQTVGQPSEFSLLALEDRPATDGTSSPEGTPHAHPHASHHAHQGSAHHGSGPQGPSPEGPSESVCHLEGADNAASDATLRTPCDRCLGEATRDTPEDSPRRTLARPEGILRSLVPLAPPDKPPTTAHLG